MVLLVRLSHSPTWIRTQSTIVPFAALCRTLSNLHARGHKEKGNINTPLQLAMDKQIDRFNLAIDVIDRVPKLRVAGAHKTLTEAYPNRFLLGLGVSHAPLVQGVRGHSYQKPLSHMRSYLDAMDSAPYVAPAPSTPPVRVIGALAPKMLKLAAERAAGAHPYFVPPEHTASARSILGKGPILAPEQAVVFETDPSKAREIARTHMATCIGLPNYVHNMNRLGFTDADIANGGSDRLVDAIVAWGNMDAVVKRVRAHHNAGADHVCVQVLTADATSLPWCEWSELAQALL